MSCQSVCVCSPQVAASQFACGTQSTYVQDQVCSDINIPLTEDVGVTTVIYASNLNPSRLFVSGVLNISNAPTDRTVTVNYYLGGTGTTPIETDTITPGTALLFNKTGFDTMELVVSAGTGTTPNITGQLCITARYPVS